MLKYTCERQLNQNDYKSWCIDGEKLATNPQDKYNIEISDKVKILTPKENINKLFTKNT